MNNQQKLSDILKRKGIGPEGSKSLKQDQIDEVKILLTQDNVSLTTKATFLTALFTLEPTEIEKKFIDEIILSPSNYLPPELLTYISRDNKSLFEKLVKKTISNQDLSESEAVKAMKFFLDPEQPEYLKASFLEGERLKRESFIENKVFFESLWKEVEHTEVLSPVLIDIADSYDGCNRTRNFSVFVATLIASAGFPIYLHGIDDVAPKEGVTSHQILKLAGKNPLKEKRDVIEDILNPAIGWSYIDQKIFFPKLFSLKKMRKEMVKRPFLATFEKLLQPIKASSGNLVVTGYTHAHYKEELVKQLKEQNECKEALVLKGVEGSTQVSMSRGTVAIHYDGFEIVENIISPEDFGFENITVPRDMSITPAISLEEGVASLRGEKGFARENILYTATLILDQFKLLERNHIKEILIEALDNGKAYSHWEKGCL